MASTRDLRFKISAEDDASQSFQRIARNASTSMADVESALDDSRTAGQRLADRLNADLDEVIATMRGTGEAADALGRALGPELSGKVDLTEAATKFQRMGLTVDEIKQEADDLADHLRRLNDVSMAEVAGELDRVGDKLDPVNDAARRTRFAFDDTAKSADGAKSAFANMVGNTGQDLGEVAGIAGSAGVAIGQMAEYASDAALAGDKLGTALSNMVAIAGPVGALAALSMGIQAIKSNLDAVAETKAFNEDRVRAFAEALSDATVTAQELANALKADDEAGIFVRIENETVNVQKAIENTLGTFDEFKAKVDQGKKGFDDYAESLIAGAKAAGLNGLELFHLREALDDARDGTLTSRLEMGQLDKKWRDGIETATALGASVTGIDTASRDAAASAAFWGLAVAQSGGDAELAARRTDEAREALRQYVAQTANVPTSIVTRINADIDQGDLARAEEQLRILTRNRTMNLSIITHGGPGYGDSNPASGKNERAKGGPVEAGGAYWVGDKFGTNSAAAELFVPDQDGTIYNQDQIARGGTPTRGGGGAPVYNLTVNAGLGANGAEIGRVLVSELKKYNRMNGTGWMK